MSMRRLGLILCALLVVAAVAPTGTVAQSSSSDNGLLGHITSSSFWTAVNVARGKIAGFILDQKAKIGRPPTPSTQAQDLKQFVNANNEDLVDHINKVVDAHNGTVRNDTYVLEVTVKKNSAGSASSFYVIATGNGSDVTSLKAVKQTDKTVDRHSTLSATKAHALYEDLRNYKKDYVQTGTVPSTSYLAREGSKYTDVGELRQQWPSLSA